MIDIKRLNELHAATTQGCRTAEGASWYEADELDGQRLPAIGMCKHPGNLISPALFSKVAAFAFAADRDFSLAAHNAWPDVAARLATLEEFAQRVRDAHCDENARIGWQTIEYWSQCAIEWLDAETEKSGE
jgi:hypothetical protein